MLLLWAVITLALGLGGLWTERYGLALAGLVACAVLVTAYVVADD